MLHRNLLELSRGAMDLLDPPIRVKPSELLANNYKIEVPGQGVDYWKPEKSPYMIEPMDLAVRRGVTFLIFVGPQRTGKSVSLINGLIFYKVQNLPCDFAVVRSTKTNAERWSHTEFARMFKNNRSMQEQLGPLNRDDNVFMKRFVSGTYCMISYPSGGEFAEKTFGMVVGTDCGKWLADVDSMGSSIDLAQKRTQSFGDEAISVFESAPGGEWADATEELDKQSHAFPSTESGIRENMCDWYNGGDRRWWYVPCSECGERYPQNAFAERFAMGGTVCIHCGGINLEETKEYENAHGLWLPEGCKVDRHGKVTGKPLFNSYPSFSIGGGAATGQTRESIGNKLEHARGLMEQGKPSVFVTVMNSDIGGPARVMYADHRNPYAFIKRAKKQTSKTVPVGVRFMIAAVDVQKDRFVVQVIGYGIKGQRWIIDRYDIKWSRRQVNKKPQLADPGGFGEDWLLLDKLIEKSYPLAGDEQGRKMRMFLTICDSGGIKGVTKNAYHYVAGMLQDDDRRHLFEKFRLIKGAASRAAPIMTLSNPDNNKNLRIGNYTVPLFLINTTHFKDVLAADLGRDEIGQGFIHFPNWLGEWWYKELTREQRGPKGWDSPKKNEAWDLMVYADAAAHWGPYNRTVKSPKGIDWINWEDPPDWAAPWDENINVFDPANDQPREAKISFGY